MKFFIVGLTLLFIGLKLTNNIDWTWFWVLSPMIFWFVLFFVLLTIAIVGRRY